jgi:hypothetical protein
MPKILLAIFLLVVADCFWVKDADFKSCLVRPISLEQIGQSRACEGTGFQQFQQARTWTR